MSDAADSSRVFTRPTVQATTLSPFRFKLPLEAYRQKSIDALSSELKNELDEYMDKAVNYYDKRRREEAGWANGARRLLAFLGTAALVLATLASAIKVFPIPDIYKVYGIGLDVWFAFLALLAYTVVGAMSFFEKATDTTASYFRHLLVRLAIRDLWTKFEFGLLKVVTKLKPGDDASEAECRNSIIALAEAFTIDLNKVSSEELAEWRTGFMTSLSYVQDATTKGIDAAQQSLQKSIDAANTAATKAEDAASAARRSTEPVNVNMTIKGEFDGTVLVLVDNQEITRTASKSIAIERLRPGQRKFQLRGKTAEREFDVGKFFELEPGIREIELSIS